MSVLGQNMNTGKFSDSESEILGKKGGGRKNIKEKKLTKGNYEVSAIRKHRRENIEDLI